MKGRFLIKNRVKNSYILTFFAVFRRFPSRFLTNFVASAAVVASGFSMFPAPAAAQAQKSVSSKTSTAAAAWPQYRPDGQPDVQGYWVAKVYGMGCLSDPRSGPGCV